jgi:hypothetical protein
MSGANHFVTWGLLFALIAAAACRRQPAPEQARHDSPAGGQAAGSKGQAPASGTGATSTAGSASARPVSSLVPPAVVAKIAGMAISGVTEPGDVCEYRTAVPEVTITLRVARGADGETAWNQAKAAGLLYNAMPRAPVQNSPDPPASADEAMFGVQDSLAIRKGGVFIGIVPPAARVTSSGEVQPLSDVERRQIANKLAETVLQSLAK